MFPIVIYTALYGGYTQLKDPTKADPSIDLICYSEHTQRSKAWGWVPCAPSSWTPRMASKHWKMRPPLDYAISIWVDANFQLGSIADFTDHCVTALGDNDLALFLHPERANIYDEAQASTLAWGHKYKDMPLVEQTEHYRALGLRDNHRLYAGGIIVRRNTARMDKMGNAWRKECQDWSVQDQLSLPYVLQVLNIEPSVIPGSVYGGPHWLWSRGADR